MADIKKDSEVQKPEKPQKKQQTISFSLPTLIIAAAVILILLIGGTLVAVNMMLKDIKKEVTTTQTTQNEESKELKPISESLSKEHDLENVKEELQRKAIISDMEDYDYTELSEQDRIVTNPLNSSKYVVLRMGFFTFDGKEKSKGEQKNILDNPRFLARIKNLVNQEFGNMTEVQIQELRLNLSEFLKSKLSPIFLQEKIYLHEVVIIQFVIQ